MLGAEVRCRYHYALHHFNIVWLKRAPQYNVNAGALVEKRVCVCVYAWQMPLCLTISNAFNPHIQNGPATTRIRLQRVNFGCMRSGMISLLLLLLRRVHCMCVCCVCAPARCLLIQTMPVLLAQHQFEHISIIHGSFQILLFFLVFFFSVCLFVSYAHSAAAAL